MAAGVLGGEVLFQRFDLGAALAVSLFVLGTAGAVMFCIGLTICLVERSRAQGLPPRVTVEHISNGLEALSTSVLICAAAVVVTDLFGHAAGKEVPQTLDILGCVFGILGLGPLAASNIMKLLYLDPQERLARSRQIAEEPCD